MYTDCSQGIWTQRLQTSPGWPTSNRPRQIERFAVEEIRIVPEEVDRKRGGSQQSRCACGGFPKHAEVGCGIGESSHPFFVL